MCCGKCFKCLTNIIIPYSILCIFLFQIYAQYSTLVTLRTKIDNKRDGRNTMTNYQLTKDKQYDFNMNKVQECFEDNALMNINFLKNIVLKFFDSMSSKKENFDIRVYMFYYLIIYDFICLVIVYLFIYGSIKFGIIKIIFQLFSFIFNWKRMQKFNTQMSVFSIIKSKLENMYLFRGWNIFNPEGFLVIEFLCNFAIIIDVVLLLIYICNRRKDKKVKKMYISDDKDNLNDDNNNNTNYIYNENDFDKNDDKKNNNDEESKDEIKSNDNQNNNKKSSEGGAINIFEEDEEDEENAEISEEEDHKDNAQETKE